MVLLNSPHNPTGKVFTAAELALIAQLCQEHDAVAVTDEVYEHLVFDGTAHIADRDAAGHARPHGADLVGRQDVLLHGVEGRLGVRPGPLVSAVLRVKQFLTFVNAGPLQPAVAVALGLPRSYFDGVPRGAAVASATGCARA